MVAAFKKETYILRRKGLMERVSSGLVLLLGNEEVGRNYKANIYEFRQDSTFLYYFGLDQPNLVGILDVDAHEAQLFGNDIDLDDIIWTGQQPSIKEQALHVGIHSTDQLSALEGVLKKATEQGRAIHFLPPYRVRNAQKLSTWLGIPLDATKQKASTELIQVVVAQRSIKSAEEIVEMERAVDISGVIHTALMRHGRAGIFEYEA